MTNETNFTDTGGEVKSTVYEYMALVWHWGWLILLVTAVCGLVAFLVTQRMTRIYQANTQVYIAGGNNSQNSNYTDVLTSERLTRTYSDMMTSDDVLEEVIKRLSLPITPSRLDSMVTITPVINTQLITITVEGENPGEIRDIANTIYTVFSEKMNGIQNSRFASSESNLQAQVAAMEQKISETNALKDKATDPDEQKRLETILLQYQQIYANLLGNYETARLTQAQSSENIVQVSEAQLPSTPVKPKIAQTTLLAALAGLIIATGGILALEALDDTIKTPEDVAKFGIPVLGTIFYHDTKGEPISKQHPRSPISEAFRTLRTNVQYANVDKPIHTLLITSPSPSEGKTTVATNLAIVMSQGSHSVTMIDADMRRPALHKRLSLENLVGLSHLFVQDPVTLNGSKQETTINDLYVITSGDLPPNPSELLGSKKMQTILEKAKEESDFLIIDSPPVLAVADSGILSRIVDGVILVVRPGSTTTSTLRQSIEQLSRLGANIIGVVMNGMDLRSARYSYYYRRSYGYYYRYYTSADGVKKKKVAKSY